MNRKIFEYSPEIAEYFWRPPYNGSYNFTLVGGGTAGDMKHHGAPGMRKEDTLDLNTDDKITIKVGRGGSFVDNTDATETIVTVDTQFSRKYSIKALTANNINHDKNNDKSLKVKNKKSNGCGGFGAIDGGDGIVTIVYPEDSKLSEEKTKNEELLISEKESAINLYKSLSPDEQKSLVDLGQIFHNIVPNNTDFKNLLDTFTKLNTEKNEKINQVKETLVLDNESVANCYKSLSSDEQKKLVDLGQIFHEYLNPNNTEFKNLSDTFTKLNEEKNEKKLTVYERARLNVANAKIKKEKDIPNFEQYLISHIIAQIDTDSNKAKTSSDFKAALLFDTLLNKSPFNTLDLTDDEKLKILATIMQYFTDNGCKVDLVKESHTINISWN